MKKLFCILLLIGFAQCTPDQSDTITPVNNASIDCYNCTITRKYYNIADSIVIISHNEVFCGTEGEKLLHEALLLTNSNGDNTGDSIYSQVCNCMPQ